MTTVRRVSRILGGWEGGAWFLEYSNSHGEGGDLFVATSNFSVFQSFPQPGDRALVVQSSQNCQVLSYI